MNERERNITPTELQPGIGKADRAAYHADEYCPTPSLSNSIIGELLRSPKHAWQAHPKLGGAPEDHSARADIGTIAHSVLLEGDESKIVVVDAEDWRTKAAQAARDEAWANKCNAILARQMDDVRAMVKVATEFIAASGMSKQWSEALPEQAVFWREGDVWCRALLDKFLSGEFIFDYKTADNAKPEVWTRGALVNGGYDVQAAWYRRGVEAVEGIAPPFLFLVQEITAPYACAWVGISPALEALANRKIDHALRLWRDCLIKNEWPAYSTATYWADPLPWQIATWEEQVANRETLESLRD